MKKIQKIDFHKTPNDDSDDLGYEEVVVHVLDSNDMRGSASR